MTVHIDDWERLMGMISRVVLAGLAIGLLAGPGLAADTGEGARLANACTSCHGLEGHSLGAAPALAGQAEEDLLAKLKGFRDGTVPATIMNRIVRGYSDEELAALAAYFSSVTP
jgi:sulfide dehydrogenase cytochrome subunit